MAAKQSVLSALHEALAQQMLDELNWYRDNEIPVPAADKAAIAKFLKDNSISCDPADAAQLEALQDEFRKSSEQRKANALRAMQMTDEDIKTQYGLQ